MTVYVEVVTIVLVVQGAEVVELHEDEPELEDAVVVAVLVHVVEVASVVVHDVVVVASVVVHVEVAVDVVLLAPQVEVAGLPRVQVGLVTAGTLPMSCPAALNCPSAPAKTSSTL